MKWRLPIVPALAALLAGAVSSAGEAAPPGRAALDAAVSDSLPPVKMPVFGRDPVPSPARSMKAAGAAAAGAENKKTGGGDGTPVRARNKGADWKKAPRDLPKDLVETLARLWRRVKARIRITERLGRRGAGKGRGGGGKAWGRQ